MPSPPPTSGFDEAAHPRGQPGNRGQFKGKPNPAPPPPRRRRRFDPSDEATEIATGLSWDEVIVELADPEADALAEARGEPDPLEEEWEGKTCVDCGLPMFDPDADGVESLTIDTLDDRTLYWHVRCFMNPTSDETRKFAEQVGALMG